MGPADALGGPAAARGVTPSPARGTRHGGPGCPGAAGLQSPLPPLVRPTSANVAATPLSDLPQGVLHVTERLLAAGADAIELWLAEPHAKVALRRQGVSAQELLASARLAMVSASDGWTVAERQRRYGKQLLAQVVWETELCIAVELQEQEARRRAEAAEAQARMECDEDGPLNAMGSLQGSPQGSPRLAAASPSHPHGRHPEAGGAVGSGSAAVRALSPATHAAATSVAAAACAQVTASAQRGEAHAQTPAGLRRSRQFPPLPGEGGVPADFATESQEPYEVPDDERRGREFSRDHSREPSRPRSRPPSSPRTVPGGCPTGAETPTRPMSAAAQQAKAQELAQAHQEEMQQAWLYKEQAILKKEASRARHLEEIREKARQRNMEKEMKRMAFHECQVHREKERHETMDRMLRRLDEKVARSKSVHRDVSALLCSAAAVRLEALETNRMRIQQQKEDHVKDQLARAEQNRAAADERRKRMLLSRSAGPPELRAARELGKRQAARLEKIQEVARESLREKVEAKATRGAASIASQRTSGPASGATSQPTSRSTTPGCGFQPTPPSGTPTGTSKCGRQQRPWSASRERPSSGGGLSAATWGSLRSLVANNEVLEPDPEEVVIPLDEPVGGAGQSSYFTVMLPPSEGAIPLPRLAPEAPAKGSSAGPRRSQRHSAPSRGASPFSSPTPAPRAALEAADAEVEDRTSPSSPTGGACLEAASRPVGGGNAARSSPTAAAHNAAGWSKKQAEAEALASLRASEARAAEARAAEAEARAAAALAAAAEAAARAAAEEAEAEAGGVGAFLTEDGAAVGTAVAESEGARASASIVDTCTAGAPSAIAALLRTAGETSAASSGATKVRAAETIDASSPKDQVVAECIHELERESFRREWLSPLTSDIAADSAGLDSANICLQHAGARGAADAVDASTQDSLGFTDPRSQDEAADAAREEAEMLRAELIGPPCHGSTARVAPGAPDSPEVTPACAVTADAAPPLHGDETGAVDGAAADAHAVTASLIMTLSAVDAAEEARLAESTAGGISAKTEDGRQSLSQCGSAATMLVVQSLSGPDVDEAADLAQTREMASGHPGAGSIATETVGGTDAQSQVEVNTTAALLAQNLQRQDDPASPSRGSASALGTTLDSAGSAIVTAAASTAEAAKEAIESCLTVEEKIEAQRKVHVQSAQAAAANLSNLMDWADAPGSEGRATSGDGDSRHFDEQGPADHFDPEMEEDGPLQLTYPATVSPSGPRFKPKRRQMIGRIPPGMVKNPSSSSSEDYELIRNVVATSASIGPAAVVAGAAADDDVLLGCDAGDANAGAAELEDDDGGIDGGAAVWESGAAEEARLAALGEAASSSPQLVAAQKRPITPRPVAAG